LLRPATQEAVPIAMIELPPKASRIWRRQQRRWRLQWCRNHRATGRLIVHQARYRARLWKKWHPRINVASLELKEFSIVNFPANRKAFIQDQPVPTSVAFEVRSIMQDKLSEEFCTLRKYLRDQIFKVMLHG
jgi:hypothetical protein